MANPLIGQNKADAFTSSQCLVVQQDALETTDQVCVSVPFDCIVKKVYAAVTLGVTNGECEIAFKTPSGTCASDNTGIDVSAIGASEIFNLTTNNTLKAGDVFEIENDGTDTSAGAASFTIVCEQNY